MQCIVFFGIQGSGKGTQAELLSRSLNFQHINIGDLFREQVAQQTELGSQVKEIIGRGELVPDDLVFKLVDSALQPGCRGIIFDGFPRTLNQAEYLLEHYQVLRVFFLELDENEAIYRIAARRVCSACGSNYNLNSSKPEKENICDLCGSELVIRKDDRPEAISKRFAEFYTQTLALKEFFAGKDLLTRINAAADVESIAAEIQQVIQDL